jgi:hypothetical protein
MTPLITLVLTATAATLAAQTDGCDAQTGLFDTYTCPDGRVLAEFPPPDDDGVSLRFLEGTQMRTGIGSNRIGLSRGEFGDTVVMTALVAGDRFVLRRENTRFRSAGTLDDPAVSEAFPDAIRWTTPLLATEDDRLLVDLTPYLARDAFGFTDWVDGYDLDADATLLQRGSLRVTPTTVEVDTMLTATTDDPGVEARKVSADAGRWSATQHLTFLALPTGFQVREAMPTVGSFIENTLDFGAPLDAPLERPLVMHWRLEPADDDPSRPAEPIVFYVDTAAPPAVREALIEGASWWADAFAAAGWTDAFRVEALPSGVDPMSPEHNVVQWVHRQTRGWSYGGSALYDPRTGEFLKGHVLLGSPRVRQDRLIFEALLGVDQTGSGTREDPIELARARLRQLVAHEVGHALGMRHNFAGSAADRSSVMDYPAPWIRPSGDTLDPRGAYAVGIGDWDKTAIAAVYGRTPEIRAAALERAASSAYISDRHARSPGDAHASAALWDVGNHPVEALYELLEVRRIALEGFGERAVRPDVEAGWRHRAFVPLYLYHRYQVEAAGRWIGGATFAYGTHDMPRTVPVPVPAGDQWSAVQSLLDTLTPDVLDIPARIDPLLGSADWLLPMTADAREWFERPGSPLFDLTVAARVAADRTLEVLLHPARAARLDAQHRNDPRLPSLEEVLTATLDDVFDDLEDAPRRRALQVTVMDATLSALGELRARGTAEAGGRAAVALEDAERRLRSRRLGLDPAERHRLLDGVAAARARVAEDPGVATPPGSPIGACSLRHDCWHCDPLH